MPRKKRTTWREVQAAVEARRPIAAMTVDLRLTGNDLAKLSPDQVQAVFEGVGRLAGQGLAR